ncbi:MAG: DUF4212 domain-containing protein [Oxalicibacterium faecigallinarum]|uniref:Sodium symporter small subunit domain-containing protein n=1 Tax=Oxalicibacterium faecigallinarum TaxID=573741 RepID=A0A8J3AV30_9BURK|nr:DUF4212 domain-containing protein [Oxalicibacterium faecigallinarum]MDQ7970285.1 DUF4212 domain-containing protein [Oxalicibacterium faecigallinarum]GGI20420.1 hypothetical protein GCM10008066_23940 [Oxalicibacterium faecigallinarum]
MNSQPATPYWRQTRRLTLHLLLVWFVVTFLSIYFARDLAAYTLLGWPVSFFMAAQGSTLIYFGIVALYAWAMRRLDQQHDEESAHEQ